MKIIIGGSRHCTDPAVVAEAVAASPWASRISAVIEGGAAGVDQLGRAWAEARSIPVTTVAADWRLGRSAGPRRNRALARDYGAEGLVLVWDGHSPGSRSMLAEAQRAGIPVFEYGCGA